VHEEKKPQPQPLLEVRNVTASYSGRTVKVLDGVSAQLSVGQTLAVVGESGSGKSTLARVVTGLLAPSAGEILFNGKALPPDCPTAARTSCASCR
jgi:peptide/nickel transport system ATP-binding protein